MDNDFNKDTPNQLLRQANSPIGFLLNAGKMGLEGLTNILLILIGVWLANIAFFFCALWRALVTIKPFHGGNLGLALLVAVVGAGFITLITYWLYRYAIMQVFKFVYQQVAPVVQEIAVSVILFAKNHMGKVSVLLQGTSQLTQVMNVNGIIKSHYPKLPRFIGKGLAIVFNRIPIASLINEMANEVANDPTDMAASKLHYRIDDFIINVIFAETNLQWLFWIVPLNILIQCALIWNFIQ